MDPGLELFLVETDSDAGNSFARNRPGNDIYRAITDRRGLNGDALPAAKQRGRYGQEDFPQHMGRIL